MQKFRGCRSSECYIQMLGGGVKTKNSFVLVEKVDSVWGSWKSVSHSWSKMGHGGRKSRLTAAGSQADPETKQPVRGQRMVLMASSPDIVPQVSIDLQKSMCELGDTNRRGPAEK